MTFISSLDRTDCRRFKTTHAVLAVLTDLREFSFFNDKRIATFTLPRSKAVALLQINMKSDKQELNHETEVTEPLPKRQKLKHITNIKY